MLILYSWDIGVIQTYKSAEQNQGYWCMYYQKKKNIVSADLSKHSLDLVLSYTFSSGSYSGEMHNWFFFSLPQKSPLSRIFLHYEAFVGLHCLTYGYKFCVHI